MTLVSNRVGSITLGVQTERSGAGRTGFKQTLASLDLGTPRRRKAVAHAHALIAAPYAITVGSRAGSLPTAPTHDDDDGRRKNVH